MNQGDEGELQLPVFSCLRLVDDDCGGFGHTELDAGISRKEKLAPLQLYYLIWTKEGILSNDKCNGSVYVTLMNESL